jgi:hypothetical protein
LLEADRTLTPNDDEENAFPTKLEIDAIGTDFRPVEVFAKMSRLGELIEDKLVSWRCLVTHFLAFCGLAQVYHPTALCCQQATTSPKPIIKKSCGIL